MFVRFFHLFCPVLSWSFCLCFHRLVEQLLHRAVRVQTFANNAESNIRNSRQPKLRRTKVCPHQKIGPPSTLLRFPIFPSWRSSVYRCVCMYIKINVYVNKYIYVCVCLYVCMYVCTYVRTYVRMYVCMYVCRIMYDYVGLCRIMCDYVGLCMIM